MIEYWRAIYIVTGLIFLSPHPNDTPTTRLIVNVIGGLFILVGLANF